MKVQSCHKCSDGREIVRAQWSPYSSSVFAAVTNDGKVHVRFSGSKFLVPRGYMYVMHVNVLPALILLHDDILAGF